jgi:hypothetical protein
MNEELKRKLAGRVPLVIAVDGLPIEEKSTYIIQLCVPMQTKIELHETGTIETTAYHLSPKEALSLAVRLTELVGPLDLE